MHRRRAVRRILGGIRRALKWSAVLAAVIFISSLTLVVALRWMPPPVTAFMLGYPVARQGYAYDWVPLEGIATGMPLAVIAAEDQKFFSHYGFDLDSIRDAIDDRLDGGALRGASTISQQVAKNLFLWPGRSFVRKGIEAYFTVLIEASWPKRRILEVYVNVAEFAPGLYGVGAASDRLFGKSAAALDDAEAALLAAVLPSPKRLRADQPSAYVRERQRWILGQMRRLRNEGVLARISRQSSGPTRLSGAP